MTYTSMNKVSKDIFAWFGWLGSKSRPFLIQQPIKVNQKPIIKSF